MLIVSSFCHLPFKNDLFSPVRFAILCRPHRSLILHHVDEDRPLPRQIRAVHTEDGAGNENDDGPMEPWHMFARRQGVHGGVAVILALQEELPGVLTLPSSLIARGGLGCAACG